MVINYSRYINILIKTHMKWPKAGSSFLGCEKYPQLDSREVSISEEHIVHIYYIETLFPTSRQECYRVA